MSVAPLRLIADQSSRVVATSDVVAGAFTFPAVPPGIYRMQWERGFASTMAIEVLPQQDATCSMPLNVGIRVGSMNDCDPPSHVSLQALQAQAPTPGTLGEGLIVLSGARDVTRARLYDGYVEYSVDDPYPASVVIRGISDQLASAGWAMTDEWIGPPGAAPRARGRTISRAATKCTRGPEVGRTALAIS